MPGIWNPMAQCPLRGPSLTHIFDRKKRSDGGCIYCGFGSRFNVCKGPGCVESCGGTYCEKCVGIRAQHALSHKMEGHPGRIEMCPPCEENRFR